MKRIDLYTDGSCLGNPGRGGWACLLEFRGEQVHRREFYGGESQTTNNRMELTAVIMGLRALKYPCEVRITLDSQYVMRGYTEWLSGWKQRGWKTSNKQPVLNRDLWEALEAEVTKHTVVWNYVEGHSQHPQNERCDLLARMAALHQL